LRPMKFPVYASLPSFGPGIPEVHRFLSFGRATLGFGRLVRPFHSVLSFRSLTASPSGLEDFHLQSIRLHLWRSIPKLLVRLERQDVDHAFPVAQSCTLRWSLDISFCSPGGRSDSSPAVHCRVGVCSGASPEGTAESVQVSRLFLFPRRLQYQTPQTLHQAAFSHLPTALPQRSRPRKRHQGPKHRWRGGPGSSFLGRTQPSLRDLCGSGSNPAVNCRAILTSPSGRDLELNVQTPAAGWKPAPQERERFGIAQGPVAHCRIK